MERASFSLFNKSSMVIMTAHMSKCTDIISYNISATTLQTILLFLLLLLLLTIAETCPSYSSTCDDGRFLSSQYSDTNVLFQLSFLLCFSFSSKTFDCAFRFDLDGWCAVAMWWMVTGGVGKSSLVLRFIKGTFRESYIPTIEDTYRQVRDFIIIIK